MNPKSEKPVAVILAAGEDVPRKPSLLDQDALVICADGGASLARVWNLRPQVIIGDLDSLSLEDRAYWEKQGVPFKVVPSRKDKTDSELAVELALSQGAGAVVLIGAWGTRIDHSLGNVELLYRLALEGIPNELVTGSHLLTAFTSRVRRTVREGSTVSLVPLSPTVQGVETWGLGYPLQGQDLVKGSTFSISNYAVGVEISVKVESGVLLLVCEQ